MVQDFFYQLALQYVATLASSTLSGALARVGLLLTENKGKEGRDALQSLPDLCNVYNHNVYVSV